MYGANYYAKTHYADTNVLDVWSISLDENITISESLTRKFYKVLTENVNVTDTLSRTFKKILSDTVVVTDSISKWLNTQVDRWTKTIKPLSSIWTKRNKP